MELILKDSPRNYAHVEYALVSELMSIDPLTAGLGSQDSATFSTHLILVNMALDVSDSSCGPHPCNN